MKNIALFCAICSVVSFIPMQGQDTMTRPSFTPKGIDIPEDYDIAQTNTLRVSLPNVDEKLVKRVWSSFARTQLRSKVRYDRKTKQHLADQAQIKSYGETNLEYASRQSGKDVNFEISFRENNYVEMEVGGFSQQRSINATNLQRNRAARGVLEDFAREVRREQTRLELVNEEKNMKKMESQLRTLKNANTRYHQEIKQAEERIAKAKSNISQNEKDQVDTQKKLQDQQKMVEMVKRKMSSI
ncbi:hypothetical protein [Haliscomenobacter sp.]|uniref:hypothetical protein n=1 Tax=Haliscomenobacter sp. TaxID=2717303 RepID=UPI0035941C3C